MDDWITQIRELGDLRDAGLLSEAEFSEQKALVLPSKTSASTPHSDEALLRPPAGQQCPTCGQLVREAKAFGQYRRGGQWICFVHRAPWCKGCARAERSQRGRFTDYLDLDWVCFEHDKDHCEECWTLVDERPSERP